MKVLPLQREYLYEGTFTGTFQGHQGDGQGH